MLSCLQIENVAVIQKAEVHFQPGLNVLTGETGAGKSILIDSINAILGNRTSKDLVRTGASKAVIRASLRRSRMWCWTNWKRPVMSARQSCF